MTNPRERQGSGGVADRERIDVNEFIKVPLGSRIARAADGQKVTFVVDGVITGYDSGTGSYTVQGNSRGAQHIDWTIEAHWATEFYEWDGVKHSGDTARDVRLSLERAWAVSCSRCANVGESYAYSLESAAEELAENGWSSDDDGQFCPQCNGASAMERHLAPVKDKR